MKIPYSTVGIESPDHQTGLQVVYWNTYRDPAAAHLQAGRAYLFTTDFDYQIPTLNLTLTPVNPPIIIPASGGSFEYDVSLANNGASTAMFDAWIMQYTPQGHWQGPMLGPINLTVPATVVVSRLRSQSVPDTAPPGVYTYRGYVGIYSAARWDSSSFTYTKSTARDGGTTISDWANTGESFAPYLTATAFSYQPSAFRLKSVSPNPFNPTAAISYELQTASYTSLKVYGVSGRIVANLVDGWQEAGSHHATFDGSRLSSGLYFVKMQAGDFTAVKKMVLIK